MTIQRTNRQPPDPTETQRFLFYSHDSWGLGHLRRSLNLASGLVERFTGSSALVVSGSACATFFPVPSGVDIVKLPSVTKNEAGFYVPRTLGGPLDGLLALRKHLLEETFRAFAPHLLVVDHQVTGLGDEALELLRVARKRQIKTILGVRDVIDAPAAVRRAWSGAKSRWALSHGYDRVCVYGDPSVFDTRAEYPFPSELGDRLQFTGYVVRPEGRHRPRSIPKLRPSVLVTMGGGEDGKERIDLYLESLGLGEFGWDSTIVTGPLAEGSEVRRIKDAARRINARRRGAVAVRRFHADLPSLLGRSDAVVSMAGYNTTAEILASGKPAVLLPRTFPRLEQAIRADRLARRGCATTLRQLNASSLRDAVERTLNCGSKPNTPPDLSGRSRFCEIAGELLGARPSSCSSADSAC